MSNRCAIERLNLPASIRYQMGEVLTLVDFDSIAAEPDEKKSVAQKPAPQAIPLTSNSESDYINGDPPFVVEY